MAKGVRCGNCGKTVPDLCGNCWRCSSCCKCEEKSRVRINGKIKQLDKNREE